MIRLLLLALVFLFLTHGVGEAVVTRYTTSSARGATGTTCSQASRCTNATAIDLSAAGDIVSMEGNTITSPYVYQGDNDMIKPPTGRSGNSGAPIAVRCEVAGGCLLDGQFLRVPLRLVYNSWWVFEDFNAKNGTIDIECTSGGTIHLSGSNHNVFRRIVAWDACITGNLMTVSLTNNSTNNTFEDLAAFGTGRKNFQEYGGSHNTICRRCWFRWEGTLGGGASGVTAFYLSTGTIFENILVTWSGESMPQSYMDSKTGAPMTNYETFGGGALLVSDRLHSTTTPKHANISILGSIVYTKASDRLPSTVSGGSAMSTIAGIRLFGGSGMTLTDVVRMMDPNHPRFNLHLGIALTRRNHNCPGLSPTLSAGPCEDPVVNNTATRLTSIRGTHTYGTNIGDSFGRNGVRGFANETDWTVTGVSAGTSLAAVQSPWQNTSTTGARVCYRWGTTTPLWPWPMNERIKQATGGAGAYSGPCPTCVGGRAARTATDVTADIEELLGTIPASCRRSA